MLGAAAIVVAPFLLYVRLAVDLYQKRATGPWMSVVVSAVITLAIVSGVIAWATRKRSGRARYAQMARWIAIPTLTLWCAYSAFYLARVNAKTDAVRSYYSRVHPVLRIALATWILIDRDLVLTDSRRVARDYANMGLPVNDRTQHYEQSDGWVHAVDLRTIGKPAIRNLVLQGYFSVTGFSTTRHVGTADHLHVQLR